MLPGYLYFDIRQGLMADALVSSLAGFISDFSPLRLLFDNLGLQEVNFIISDAECFAIKGRVVHFYLKDIKITLHHQNNWPKDINNQLVKDCLTHESIAISSIKDLFRQKNISPITTALAIKILNEFEADIFTHKVISGQEALWVICHLAMLLGQIEVLDPKYIMSSKPILINHHKARSFNTYSITDGYYLHQALKNIPMIEDEDGACADVLAVLFIKNITAHYGLRGEGVILNTSIGHGDNGIVEALWCEASLPQSMKECGPNNQANITFLYEISGLVKTIMDMNKLASMLYVAGARNLSWHMVHGENSEAYYHVSFSCHHHDKAICIESFLLKGEALSVLVNTVEQHMLNQRLVSAPIGQGNKISSARFYEYIYYDKTVRVEPLSEDIDAYIEKTGYSVDVARADLLLAWKKWRKPLLG